MCGGEYVWLIMWDLACKSECMCMFRLEFTFLSVGSEDKNLWTEDLRCKIVVHTECLDICDLSLYKISHV